MGLILASTSPRRKQLLETLGLEFTVLPGMQIDESKVLAEQRGDLCERMERLALLKGDQVAKGSPNEVVISADTVVYIEGEVLGKPRDVDEAREMLTRLSGRTHQVFTAVAVQRSVYSFLETGCESTNVTFNLVDRATIDRYIARAEPYDKAGSYAIQGLGALLIRKIEGDYGSVVGLPLGLTARLLTAAGIDVL